MIKLLSLLYGCAILGTIQAATEFDYYSEDYGPDQWSTLYTTCGGNSQSPIDIVPDQSVLDEILGLFTHELFADKLTEITLVNDGHELVVDVTNGAYTINDMTLLDGAAYTLQQFHFHWSDAPSNGGSEHTVDGKHTYGEMHLVHYNTKYPSFSEAKTKPDGLAVLAFFLQSTYPQDNLAFDRMLFLLSNGTVNQQDDSYAYTEDQLFSVDTLLPHDISMYYRYQGSLTTPTCDESVLWTVFKEPILISENQATTLSTGLTTNMMTPNHTLNNNFRPIQPINGRIVSHPLPLTQCNAAVKLSVSIMMLGSLLLGLFQQ